MKAYLKVANLDMNMQGEMDFSNPNIALYYTDNFRKPYFGTSISSYPLPVPAKNLMSSGFIRITTYLGSDGSL